MIDLRTPTGVSVRVPETLGEDPSPHFAASDLAGISAYYEAHGYAVVDTVLEPAVCDMVREHWASEVKPSKRPIYRQASSQPELHSFNAQGWVMNPILNPQSVDPAQYPRFRHAVREGVLNSPKYSRALSHIFGERPKVVQAMYFEGNSETGEHQDSIYLDSEQLGTITAVWFALEDIEPEAGRFFIYPGSHAPDWPRLDLAHYAANGHDTHIASVIARMEHQGRSIRAPAVRKGDAVFWNAYTVHGSLASQHESRSRSSITCHAIPASHKFLKLQHVLDDVPVEDMGNVLLYAPKDQAQVKYRLAKWCEWTFPAAFAAAKRAAIKAAGSR